MKTLRVACATAALVVLAMTLPATATAFEVLDTSTGPVANAYGNWYAGQAKCASPECHKAIVDEPTPHANMITDVKANPGKLLPEPSLWPAPNPLGGLLIEASDAYLRLGDGLGLVDYVGPPDTTKYTVSPAGDLPVWYPVGWLIEHGAWQTPTTAVGARAYNQSCSGCHNLGLTRPSDQTYTLANGGTQATDTPSAVAGLSIQCEVCHGSGKDPAASSHSTGVPEVVSGAQILKAQVCGQCHVSGTAPEKGTAGAAFGSANGYTTDETLTAYFTATTSVPSEASMTAYVTGQPGAVKPAFLPNGANYSMRHSYYNEWLLNKAENGKGHVDPLNSSAATDTVAAQLCRGCHSGLGFLHRIKATYPSPDGVKPGSKIQTDTPSVVYLKENDPGISCQVCHTGHVAYGEHGYDLLRTWGEDSSRPGAEVGCGDCHNWQYEALNQTRQTETIDAVTYERPAVNQRVRHPQREMVRGGFGGDAGTAGMWGVEPSDVEMGSTSCEDCHMPRTAKEGGVLPSNAGDTGDVEATRMSHRFHPVLPGDAKRWNLRPNGDSCVAECHNDEASAWDRDQFQAWIDEVQGSVVARSADDTAALGAIAVEYGLSAWTGFMAAQPADPAPASALSAAEWTMLQRAAQNVDFVINDASKGVHNARYAKAGLDKAAYWIASFDPDSFTIETDGGYCNGDAGFEVRGALRGHDGSIIKGANVALEASADGGATWDVRGSADASATSFAVQSGKIVGDTMLRFAFSPAAGVTYYTATIAVSVPKTTVAIDPASAAMGWFDAPSVAVTVTAAPTDAITFCALSGAQTQLPGVYGGPFSISAEGATTITYWSVNELGSEAIHTALVRIDRSLPSVGSDAKTLYSESATIKLTASDAISPVASVEYSLDGGAWVPTTGATASVTTSALGSHTLKARATDSAGHVSPERSWTFSVKSTPKMYRSPNTSGIIKRLYQSQTLSVTLKRGTAPIAGKYVYLERSTNGRTWSRYATLKTISTGVASKSVKFSARGYTWWRWTSPSDSRYNLARTSPTRVTVR